MIMVKVALAQFRGSRDREANIAKAEDMIGQAAANGAQVIAFPELCNTMYFCFERNSDYFEWAEPVPGPSVERIAAAATAAKTVVVFPLFEVDDGHFYNSAAVLGPDGELIGKYRKMSIPRMPRTVRPGDTASDEQFYFERGNLGFPVFDTPFGIRLGLLICYDRHFPEAARTLALNGAHVVLVPTATSRDWTREVWEAELRGHAIANNYYVGGINKVGPDIDGFSGRDHFGSSVAFDPSGAVLVRAARDLDQIVEFDVDPAVVEDQREVWGFFRERRSDAYGSLVGVAGASDADVGGQAAAGART
jgi:beta-ureidopropionase